MGASVEGGEGALEGLERLLEVNPGVFRTKEAEDWGQKFYSFRGRTPAEQPDVGEALRALRDFIRPFRALLNPLLVGLLPAEDEERFVYSTPTLFWTVAIGFIEHLHSRNQMDMARNARPYAETVMAVSGQRYRPDDPKLHTACSQTWQNRLSRVDSARLEDALLGLVRYLIRGRWFDEARVCGRLAVAVDGTLRERIRSRTLGEREKRRYVLEARIVTPWGWNIPVMSEPVDSYDGEREKQDCEMNAFKRLASRLKKAFVRQGFCIIGDALYACGPVIDICEKYGWEYILVFKEGSAPKRYRHAHAALVGRDRERPIMGRAEDGTEQLWGRVEWVDASEIRQSTGEEFRGAVVTCRQWYPFESCYDGEFVTSFPVNDGARAELIACWGRRRWNIENGFNAQKNDGFGLEHTFCNDDRASRNLHTIMEIAYALWQVFDTGMLKRLGASCRKMTQRGWGNLLFIAILVIGFREIGGFGAEVPVRRMSREHLIL